MSAEEHNPATQVGSMYNKLADNYDQDYVYSRSARGLMMEAYDTVTWAFIDRYLPCCTSQRPRALDAGGGTGKWSLRLIEQGLDVELIDISDEMIKQAKEKASELGVADHLQATVASVTDIPYKDETFDFVLCEGDPVSYCLDEGSQAVKELIRVARPQAHIVLGVDNLFNYFWSTLRFTGLENALSFLESQRARCPYGLPVHAFSPQELTDMISGLGAEVVRIVGKPLIVGNMLAREPALLATIAKDSEHRQKLLQAEVKLADAGYGDGGGHLQVICKKR